MEKDLKIALAKTAGIIACRYLRARVGAALLAFASFSAAASAVYLFNDLRDRERDRAHPLKRHRPLASGRLSPAVAAVAALLLAAAAAAVAVRLGVAFGLALGAYLAINLLYTLALKRLVILDVMAIAAGFLLRVLGGAAAIPVAVSPWLLILSLIHISEPTRPY